MKNNSTILILRISAQSDLKRRSFRLFDERRPNKNNKMSSDMGSVPDTKSKTCRPTCICTI